MDDKEVRIDLGLGTSINNDCNKRLPNSSVMYASRDKSYSDTSHPLGKTDSRPCAIIGPDRVLPSTDTNDVYMKTIPIEPWEYPDNYRHPYDSIKMAEYHPTHNISPRQTFQENMQRTMVPPTYSSIKSSDETSLKNPKLNIPTEGKYCDVPYSINTLSSEPKSVRCDSAMPTVNPSFPRGVQPHGWPGGAIQPLKPYPAHDYYHNSEYSNCPASRSMPIVQPQRVVHNEIHPMYNDRLYQDSNIRFKPYPTSKEKLPQPRYEYANTFQPPPNPIPKFDIQKSMHGHHYPMYPQGPYRYTVDRRYAEPVVETHPRALYPQHNTFRNHPIHTTYGPVPGNYYQNKPYPCPTDNTKSMHANKLSYDANNKIYLELENSRFKGYPSPDNYYYSDRAKLMRGDILLPGHTQMNSMSQQHLYKKDNLSIKSFEHLPHYPYRDHRNLGNPLARMSLQFSPNTVPISPCDSNTGNEASMLGIPQEDCGYVSQSSTTSIRSLESNNSPADFYKRQEFNYTSNNVKVSQRENNPKHASSTDKKGLNLSQFFQMWNEGDEEDSAPNNNNNEVKVKSNYVSPKPQVNNNQEELYVLGSVTVSQEELSKYEHLQKVSKLPENIKGFNNIEILNQFEQLVESPGINNLHPPLKEYKVVSQPFLTNQIQVGTVQRPVSPLDVEAKISQSVIHKEVGCNFEIKPCSPKVLNVDVAAPVHDMLGERFIEKVANPVMLSSGQEAESKIEIVDKKVTSCKMANAKFNQNSVNSTIVKPLFPLQDLNTNMGVCLASLPQLDSDIDLNLPEVNQQFIDANKIEVSISPHQNVLQLENTQQNNSSKNNAFNQIHNEGSVTYPEADKETIKLSKYRKTKRADNLVNNAVLSSSCITSAQRIDSVIKKNPENAKECTEIENESLELENNIVDQLGQENNTETPNNVANSECNDKAIDFSLNRIKTSLNTKSKDSESNSSSTKESHFCQSDNNLSKKGENKTKKSEKSFDLRLIANSDEKVNENLINLFNSSDSHNCYEKKSYTNVEAEQNLITSKESPPRETKFNDLQSEINMSTYQQINELSKEKKMNTVHHSVKLKNDENSLFSDNLISNRCDNLNNNLPDLSFEMADISNEQSTVTNINGNLNKIIDDPKLETAILEYTNVVIDGQTNNVYEIPNRTEQTYSKDDESKIVEDTSKLVDTIEKELEDMDTKCDVTSSDLSEIEPLTTSEYNTNCLLQENLDEALSSVSVIKSSDPSSYIEYEEFSISATNNSNKFTSTDLTVEGNSLQKHDETMFSDMTNNDKDKLNVESPSSKKKTTYKDEKSYPNKEKLCHSIGKDSVDSKLKSDTSDELKCEDNEITAFNSTTVITAVDTNYKDCKLPVSETSCEKQQEIVKNDQDTAGIALNDSVSKHELDDDSTRCYDYEKFTGVHYERRVHRKALFSPWIQNLILYSTDSKILHKHILNDTVHSDENIDKNIHLDNRSNNKVVLDDANENVNEYQNNCASKSVEVLQNINESAEDVQEKNVVDSDNNYDRIFRKLVNVDEEISEIDAGYVSPEFGQANLVRCPTPLTYSYDNTKLVKRTSKRSLSDSALRFDFQDSDRSLFSKRFKTNEEGFLRSSNIDSHLSNILRRNSISEIYNDGNVVILIDKDLILTEEKQETNICFADEEEIANNYDSDREIIDAIAENLPQYEKELWVEDVAEDVEIGTPSSPKDFISSNYETVNNESFMLCEEVIKNMENDVDINEFNMCHDSTYTIHTPYDYHDSNVVDDIFTCLESPKDSEMFTDDKMESNRRKAENILNHFETSTALFPKVVTTNDLLQDDKENVEVLDSLIKDTKADMARTNKLHVEENSDCENYENYSCTLSTCNYSSSPEVSSTTCEDKNPGIILKISNHKSSKSSQLDDSNPAIKSEISYKQTDKKKYEHNFNSSGTLITKAAQKYIPPIKITISDLKIKLPLPKNSLDKLKKLKKSKVEPKIVKKPIKTYNVSSAKEMKKPKPKFEDVLMSIDKFQYSRPKVKNKKTRDVIPKVVIKKNESGAHYTSSSSSSSEDTSGPDLTGRKWQPWVFIEKNTFIDNMALKHKVKAIYCRRKKTYILAEKFRKYKSVYNGKFVISQPKSDDLNKGNLKYTIRLKHH